MKLLRRIPNYLTISRMAAIPVIIFTFYLDESVSAHRLGALLFTIASITDFLDGYLARRWNLTSSFGEMFDPIADKVLVGCVLVMLVKKGKAAEIPAMLILAREFVVAGLREFLAQLRVSVPVSRLAKSKTCIQMIALIILILGTTGSGIKYMDQLGQFLLWIAAGLTIITGVSYLKACNKYFKFSI